MVRQGVSHTFFRRPERAIVPTVGGISLSIYQRSRRRARRGQRWDVPTAPRVRTRPATYLVHVRDSESAISTSWGTFVKSARETKGLTIDELADLVDVDRKTIMRMESGGTQRIDLKTFMSICRALNVRPADAVAALDPDGAVPLPPPLPVPIARLVDNYLSIGNPDDQRLLLERVDWVNQWIEFYLERQDSAQQRRVVRRRA